MKRLSARRLTLVLASFTAAGIGLTAAAPALGAKPAPAPKAYVALGDSYSSGTGTGSYLNDGTSCQRSVYAYPSLDAAALGLTLTFRACSGATVSDVTSVQLDALSGTTNFVTVSVGGNDAGFADVVSTCAGSDTTACLNAINGAQSFITTTLPGRLTTLYGSIKVLAPNAKVIVVGYPRLFNGTDCSIWTSFTTSELTALNATADLLNGVIATAASGAGAVFADPTQKFAGHAVCDGTPWINNVNVFSLSESFHPNRAGHRDGYAALTQPLFGTSGGGKGKPRSAAEAQAVAEASADDLARDAARYAAVDRTITPETFRLPQPASR
jgi:lysophospholipase L1-like esterase